MTPFLRPADPGYDEEIVGYNRIVDHRPELVVPARSAADVVRAVRAAATEGLSLAVQATGHGPSVAADGVLVSTRHLREVRVDPATRLVRVDAGARGRDLTAALVPHGLAPLGGSSPDVGVVGYHLGGGLPLLGRTFGYAADRVRALDVVTADGERRTLTPDDDLFGAVLGCRGAFAVVVSLLTEALPLTSVTGGGLWFTGDAIEPAVRAYLRWTADVPETVNSSVLLIRLPDLPVIPEPIRGRRIAHIRIAAVGGDDAVDLAPLRAAGPVRDTVAEVPVARLGSIHDEPSGPVFFEARNSLLGALDDAAAAALLDHADNGFFVELRHLGGALARDGGAAAVGRRDGRYVVYTGSALPDPSVRDAAAAAQARLHDALAPWGIGAVTPAFLTGRHELSVAFSAADQARLARLKKTWDPDDRFRVAPFRVA
jgi:FAD/FMN-containing dehydrogenase